MSAAERTAHQVYEKYHLGTLPNDVKDQIIILMLSNRHNTSSYTEEDETANGMLAEDIPTRQSIDQLHSRVDLAKSQIEAGMAQPIDEFFDEMDAKYPWLCK